MSEVDDVVGHETLHRIASSLDAYNTLMYDQVASFVGGSVLEIGSGIGNLSQFFAGTKTAFLTDVSPAYVRILEERFGHLANVDVALWDLGVEAPSELVGRTFDTAVCFNVLEHIEDDVAALERIRRLLDPSGVLALLVPAHQFLFNGLDSALGHFRRYDKRSLSRVLASGGFDLEKIWYFNALGTLGWFVNGTILRRRILPEGQMKAFDHLVKVVQAERFVRPPFGLSVIAIARPAPGHSP